MSEPVHADNKPAVLKLEKGMYMICSCGRSENQPYCDGSHHGTDFTPIAFDVEEEKTYAICNCKISGNMPLCDGTHKTLPVE